MALHGLLSVNGATVGGWEAVRRDELAPGWHLYDVQVWAAGRTVTGQVEHRFADGAPVLAAKSLQLHASEGADPGVPQLDEASRCHGLDNLCGLVRHHRGGHLLASQIPTTLPTTAPPPATA